MNTNNIQNIFYSSSSATENGCKDLLDLCNNLPLYSHLTLLKSAQYLSYSANNVDGWIIAEAEVLDQIIVLKAEKLDLLDFQIRNTKKQLDDICLKREKTFEEQNEAILELTGKFNSLNNKIDDKNLEIESLNYQIQLLNDELQNKKNRKNEIVDFLNRINLEPDQEHLIYRRETEKPLNVLLYVLMLIISLFLLWGLIGKHKILNESYVESSNLQIIETHEKFR